MKFCKDCKYYSRYACKHPEALSYTSVIDGEETYDSLLGMRLEGKCGKEAVLFEQREIKLGFYHRVARFFKDAW